MITLAILEHLQKIPYLISLFVPVALFFFAGLALSRWIWYKDARRLQSALSEHDRLANGLASGYQKKHDLGARFSGLFEKHQKHWEGELSDRDGKITDLNDELSSEATRFADLDSSFSSYKEKSSAELGELEAERTGLKSKLDERESKLGSLKGDLSKNVAALGLLQTQFDDGKGETNQLRSKVKDLDSSLGGKDQELAALKQQLADLEKGSADKENEINKLRDQIAGLENASKGHQKEVSDLKSQLSERESKLGGLESDLAKNVTAMGLLKTQSEGGKNESEELKSQVAELKAQLAKQSEASADLARLQDQLKAAQAEKEGVQSKLTQANLNLESEKNRQPKPAGAMSFFADSGAKKDEKLGFLYSSRPSKVDDLTKISGVGPVLQPKLNDFGVYQYKQVALWSQDNIDAFSEKLDFKGRVEREQWVNQAADLHREEHGEHLAPIVNIYHKPQPAAAPAAPAKPDPFAGEPVKVDPTYGVLYTARPSKIDDLKRISGVAEVLEAKLHEIGLYRFKQIAMWTDKQAADFSDKLAFPGRVERDEWVKQAAAFHAEKYGDS